MRKKLVVLSSIAAPQQIKFCNALQRFYDTTFLFYNSIGQRANWWQTDLGKNCIILDNVWFKDSYRYITTSHLKKLDEINPDILLFGSLSIPSNYLAYRWARKNNKKVIFFTERSRDKSGNIRKKSFVWTILRKLYAHLDLLMVSARDIIPQFRDELGFGDIVVESRYASDIDAYFEHPLRVHNTSGYTYMFANRLTENYNPIGAIDIFAKIIKDYPASKLVMNALGELRENCEQRIKDLKLENAVRFLDNIESWDKLNQEYAACDILLFPAKFSNGNFTIIEAMASGMGVIISNKILGIGKLIENNKNGFNINNDEKLFLEKVAEYHENPDLLTKHAKLNRDIVRPLGPDGTAKLYYDLIESRLFNNPQS